MRYPEDLPLEVLCLICRHLSAADVWTLRGVSSLFRSVVDTGCIWSVPSFFQRIVSDVDAFRSVLRDTGTVVTGAAVGQWLAREPAVETQEVVVVAFVPELERVRVGEYLAGSEAFLLRADRDLDLRLLKYRRASLVAGDRVQVFSRPGVAVVLVPCLVAGLILDSVVQLFRITSEANYVTADMAVSLFPQSTFIRREVSLIQPSSRRLRLCPRGGLQPGGLPPESECCSRGSAEPVWILPFGGHAPSSSASFWSWDSGVAGRHCLSGYVPVLTRTEGAFAYCSSAVTITLTGKVVRMRCGLLTDTP